MQGKDAKKAVQRMAARATIAQAAIQGGQASRAMQDAAQPESESITAYAEQKVQTAVEESVATAGNVTLESARIPYMKYKAMQAKRQQRAESAAQAAPRPAAESPPPVGTELPPGTEPAPRQETIKKSTNKRTIQKRAARRPTEPLSVAAPEVRRETVKRNAYKKEAVKRKNAATGKAAEAPPQPRTVTQKELKRRHITAQAVRKKLAEKAAARPVPSAMMKLPETGPKRAATDGLRRVLQAALQKIKTLLVKIGRAVVDALAYFFGGGAVVLLLAVVIGAAAAIIGSPLGILFADESGDPNAIPIREIVLEANTQFGQAINRIVDAHPECSEVVFHYDYEDGHTWASYWPEVLAIFAVNNNLNGDSDVIVIDRAKADKIIETFWMMHRISYEVEEIEVPAPEPDPDADPDADSDADPDATPPPPTYEYVLHITVSSRTVDELAADLHFTADQNDILRLLLSDEMRPALLALCGSLPGIPADGALLWPLPGHTYISCYFGAPDAYGNPGHKGIDIPAPEGTPILAAHGGTVMVAGWNDSYGNQVLLDSGSGVSTRYAHMTATAVAPGQPVSAGDVIGHVGDTGDSEGNHLHLELYVGDVRTDPLSMLTPS